MDLNTLATLLQHRWNIAALAALYSSDGAKFVTLLNQLQIGRASLSTTLSFLIEQNLVTRNSGYGHPMRPEYVLTDHGREVGEQCAALTRLISDKSEQQVAFRKWSLPLIAAIGRNSARFNKVREALGDPTPRALTLALKALEKQKWLRRKVGQSYPPQVSYELSPRGLAIFSQIAEERTEASRL